MRKRLIVALYQEHPTRPYQVWLSFPILLWIGIETEHRFGIADALFWPFAGFWLLAVAAVVMPHLRKPSGEPRLDGK